MKLLTAATVLSVVFSAAAYADDGSWNAGASTQLPNGTGGNDGRSNAGASNYLSDGTGGVATSEGRNVVVTCDHGRCVTRRISTRR
jgi:hypothetical protein